MSNLIGKTILYIYRIKLSISDSKFEQQLKYFEVFCVDIFLFIEYEYVHQS